MATLSNAQTFPEPIDKYVNDYIEILTAAEANELRDMLRELDEERGIEFTFVGIDRMSRYGHNGEIEPFATGLFNTWGIGNASRNDGLLLLVAKDDRKLRIEVGSGYGTSLDAPMKGVIDTWIVPRFRDDQFGAGILNGTEQAIYKVTGAYPGHFDRSPLVNRWIWLKRTAGVLLFALVLPGGWLVWKSYKAAKRRYPRKCPVDGTTMGRILDEFEINHLNEGQLTEERVGSVDYDIWKCPTCEHKIIEAYTKRGFKFGACRECGYRTAENDTKTIYAASHSSTGLRRTTYNCKNCSANYSVDSIIPVLTYSSGSSGGSFGGGRSSGGGASGGW